MMHFIVNADDYGYDRNRTEAIRECFRNGLLTQTTAMVNMPYCDTAIAKAKQQGFHEKIGLHLNLTFGTPLTEAIKKSPLFCNPDGSFSGRFHRSSIWRLWLPLFERKSVECEIRAQMEKYKGYGLTLGHVDSHHHSHTDPTILGIVLRLAKQYGFRSIRISRNLPVGGKSIMKKVYKNYINRTIVKAGFLHADYFGSAEEISKGFPHLPDGSIVEMMVHPLYVSGRDMPLNMEHDSTDGELCDTFVPITRVMRCVDEIRSSVSRMTYSSLS